MAFVVPRGDPLTPRVALALDVDPGARVLRAVDLAAYCAGEQVFAAARAQAAEIVADARVAYDAEMRRGYEDGTEQARREAARHMAEQLARTDEFLASIEDKLVGLVIQATRRIVEGFSERDRVVHSVRNALAMVRNQAQITAKVHPDQLEFLLEQREALLASYPAVKLLDVVADSRLALGTCIIESPIGKIEASIDGQLAALEGALQNIAMPRPPRKEVHDVAAL